MTNKFKETDGVWRTVGGRRIFIKNGDNLSTAMRKSGKFDSIIRKNEREIPSVKYNDDVRFICKIRGIYKLEKEYGKLLNHDVVLTNERKKHILERRGKQDYGVIMKNMDKTLKEYDYIFNDTSKGGKGVVFVKKVNSEKFVALFVKLSLTNKKFANSHITGIVLNQKSFNRYFMKRKIIDKKV